MDTKTYVYCLVPPNTSIDVVQKFAAIERLVQHLPVHLQKLVYARYRQHLHGLLQIHINVARKVIAINYVRISIAAPLNIDGTITGRKLCGKVSRSLVDTSVNIDGLEHGTIIGGK